MIALLQMWADRLRGLTGWRRYGAAMALGMATASAFPPFNAIPALWVGFPALCFLVQGASNRRSAFAIGWSFSFGLLTVCLYWIAGALFVDIAKFWWLVPFAVAGLPAAFALYYGLASLAAWRWGASRADGILILAVAWALADYGRGHLFTGFPWDLTGYVWSGVLPVLQTTSVLGIYGLTALTLLLAVAPALALAPARSRFGVGVAAFLAALFVGFALWGSWRLDQALQAVVPNVRLRLVQPNIAQTDKWRRAERERHFERLLALTSQPSQPSQPPQPGQSLPTVVLWPETATAYYLTEELAPRQAIARHLGNDAILLTGALQRGVKQDGTLMYFNSLLAIDSKAEILAGYAKFHLVPFGEYVPFRRFLPFRAVAAVGDFTPGAGLMTLRAIPGVLPFSPLICYEAIFPGETARKDDRPSWLVNVTNDAWYEGTIGPAQHFAIARVRAIEEGLPLARVANKGITAIVDSVGRVRERISEKTEGVVDGALPVALPTPTYYAKFGDFAWWLVEVAFLFVALLARYQFKRRHERKKSINSGE